MTNYNVKKTKFLNKKPKSSRNIALIYSLGDFVFEHIPYGTYYQRF